MVLYHGTSKKGLEGIMKSKSINNSQMSEETHVVNKALELYFGEDFRDGAIYLTPDLEVAEEYEHRIEIPINNLNTKLLYVADYSLASYLYELLNGGSEREKIGVVEEYQNSIIPYEYFLMNEENVRNSYGDIELLYFDKIEIN